MRRSLILAAVIAAILLFPLSSMAVRPSWPTQNGFPIESNMGCLEISTPTIELVDTIASAPDLADYLPAGCTGFEGRVTYGEVILAHGDNLATGTFATRVGKLYASGSTIIWTGLGSSTAFVGKVCANGGTASITIDLAW